MAERRRNTEYFQEKMSEHPYLMIQKEIGSSSWFGFSLIVKPGSAVDRSTLIGRLNSASLNVDRLWPGILLETVCEIL